MSKHSLEDYLHHTFGDVFAAIALAGYCRPCDSGLEPILVPPRQENANVEWMIELTGARPYPYADDPLVLAALLKILLNQSVLSDELEFSTEELTSEVGWPRTKLIQRRLDTILIRYATLVYFVYRKGKREMSEHSSGEWKYESLVRNYQTRSLTPTGSVSEKRIYNRISFDEGFIAGLQRGRVVFAELEIGDLQSAQSAGK